MKNHISETLLKVIRQSVGLTLGLLITVAGTIGLGLLPPLVLERMVNLLTEGQPFEPRLILLYVALLAAAGIFEAARETLITMFGQKVTHSLRSRMCAKLSELPASYFSRESTGSVVSLFVNDVDTVETLFRSGVISMAVDLGKVAGILAVILVKSRGLGILMLAVTPLLFAMTRFFQKRMLRAQLDNRKAVSVGSGHVPETIRNIRMIHTLQQESYMEGRYDDFIRESCRAVERINFYDAVYSPIVLTISALLVAVMMVMAAMGGGMQSFFGMSVGTAVAVIAYVEKVFEPLESIGMEIQNIQSAAAGMHRINDFLNQNEIMDDNRFHGVISSPSSEKSERDNDRGAAVCLESVCFGYSEGQEVLHDCSLQVNTGECVTITGRTGAGKSTVFKLIMGLYAPRSGRVMVFGRDVRCIGAGQRRHVFGYVEQKFCSVPGSVRDQITLYEDELPEEAVRRAAGLAGLDEILASLEQGYDTPFSEKLFSQGQLQLLAIARAVVCDPDILLLDEMTANLDSDTEAQVMKALQAAGERRTVISISHRLSEGLKGRRICLESGIKG